MGGAADEEDEEDLVIAHQSPRQALYPCPPDDPRTPVPGLPLAQCPPSMKPRIVAKKVPASAFVKGGTL